MNIDIEFLRINNLILLECISGSKAYGLDTPESDTDIKGVFYLPKNHFFGLHYTPQVNNETNDIVYYELGRFIELLLKNNPSALELLATPENCILFSHPVMEKLNLALFLSKLAKETFAGYAATQIKKSRGLNKKIHNPQPKERKSILDFCYILQDNQSIPLYEWLTKYDYQQSQCGLASIPHIKGLYALFYDFNQTLGYKGLIKNDYVNSLNLSSIPQIENPVAHLYCNTDGYSTYCKEYYSYWDWVEKRNEARYQMNQTHGADYDSKNMMHTIRLLQIADQIVTHQSFSVYCKNRNELLAIKKGAFTYDELLTKANHLLEEIEQKLLTCTLPEEPDQIKISKILIEMRSVLYK